MEATFWACQGLLDTINVGCGVLPGTTIGQGRDASKVALLTLASFSDYIWNSRGLFQNSSFSWHRYFNQSLMSRLRGFPPVTKKPAMLAISTGGFTSMSSPHVDFPSSFTCNFFFDIYFD
mgnify:CR=1 FL=1